MMGDNVIGATDKAIGSTFELSDLVQILREGAGADESVNLDGDILDISFEDLGYESLALLETASRIGRRYGVEFDEVELIDLETPRDLIDLVNRELRGTA